MLIVHVHAYVKPGRVDEFVSATLENARNSVQEDGVARFDILRDSENPTHFVLNEVYRDGNAPSRHKETSHYIQWRDTVAEMMAEPRRAEKFSNLFPEDAEY